MLPYGNRATVSAYREGVSIFPEVQPLVKENLLEDLIGPLGPSNRHSALAEWYPLSRQIGPFPGRH